MPATQTTASSSTTAAASGAGAPTLTAVVGASQAAQEAAFAADPRIHYSTVTRRWVFEDDDGNEWEYDDTKGVWMQVVDEELLRKQQAAYSVAGVDEEAPAAPVLKRQSKKRKELEDFTSATPPPGGAGPSKRRGKNDSREASAAPKKSKNTAIFVTRLPPDTTADELVERFSRCGVIEEDDEGDPKVKLYARDDGSFSGEALVVFFKEESVTLAETLLDDAELRFGDPSTVMSVRKAEFTHKADGTANGTGEQGQKKVIDKKKASRRIGKMQKKLEDWDSDDELGSSADSREAAAAANKNNRVVVLKHMFTLKQLQEDATLLLDLKEDVREECSTLGEVTNVILYDEEPEGIMTVKFRDPVSAQACVFKMNGRYFDGRRIEASLYYGNHRYKRSGTHDDIEGEGDAAEKQRLDDFAQWLMTEGD